MAGRLRSAGGTLDDASIMAVAEMAGVDPELIRMHAQLALHSQKASLFDRMKSSFLAFDPKIRNYVAGAWLGLAAGVMPVMAYAFRDGSGLFGGLASLASVIALWNCTQAKEARTAITSGTISAIVGFLSYTFPVFLINFLPGMDVPGLYGAAILAFAAGGATFGGLAWAIRSSLSKKMGWKDPAQERQELLHRLLAIQEELRSVEQYVTFLSIDVVGSTRMKKESDALSAEFTFTEYHRYIENITRRFGGRVHSTAGDGVTAAFDLPGPAFQAARAMQSGLFEFNAFRNKLEQEFVLRIGVHSGKVMAPGHDVKQVNFASVIDIAAHLQKLADPGTVVISEEALNGISALDAPLTDERLDCDGVAARMWRQRVQVETQIVPN